VSLPKIAELSKGIFAILLGDDDDELHAGDAGPWV
jgi:hypothetical protein